MKEKEDVNILVVDDEQIIITSCERILRGEGYNVASALRGKEAIFLMEKNDYDLVLTDIKMPEMDGINLMEWIRASKPDTGVVVITGYPSQDTIVETLKLGCLDYLPKPFTPAVLTDVTYRALEKVKGKPPLEKPVDEPQLSMNAEFNSIISKYRGTQGNLIPVLQETQELLGYLPPTVQRHIAKELGIPASEIHSVVSFYSFFTMKPRGKHLIRVCLGTACYVKRAEEILHTLKGKLNVAVGGTTEDRQFSLEEVRCLGACGLAPVMMVDQETYGAVNLKKAVDALEAYK